MNLSEVLSDGGRLKPSTAARENGKGRVDLCGYYVGEIVRENECNCLAWNGDGELISRRVVKNAMRGFGCGRDHGVE